MIEEKLLSRKPIKIIMSRTDDIKVRGRNHEVHDYNGKIVKLENASIWTNFDGDYVEPRSYIKNNNCIIS